MMPILQAYELERLEADCKRAGVLAEYKAMVASGTFPRAAAMYALQQPAGTRNTDRAFCEGAHRQMESMTPINRQAIQKIAKRAGISTDGKFYKGALGRYDDPAAWVSCADDVITVAKRKRLDIEGVVNFKGVVRDDLPPPKPKGLAPDLVNEFAAKELLTNPALAEKCRNSRKARMELREAIIEKHGPKKRPKKGRRLLA